MRNLLKLFQQSVDNSIVWYVVHNDEITTQSVDEIRMDSTVYDTSAYIPLIYPNPFENLITVESPSDDVLTVLSPEGKLLMKF